MYRRRTTATGARKRKPMTIANPLAPTITSIVDRADVLERVGGDEELLREIIGIFLEEYPSLVAGIRNAVEKQDARALERSAHNLKGCVSNFGAPSATQAALDLELMGRKGEIHRARAVVQILELELIALHSALNDLQAS
jgi:two-component system, sensor histidine kinase and response regulator